MGLFILLISEGTGKSEPKLQCKIDEQLPLIAKGELENYLAKLKLVVEKCKEAMNGYSNICKRLEYGRNSQRF